jgi:hypothetical protein
MNKIVCEIRIYPKLKKKDSKMHRLLDWLRRGRGSDEVFLPIADALLKPLI